MSRWLSWAVCFAVGVCVAGAQGAKDGARAGWVASWASSMMAPEPQNGQPGIDAATLTDATVRQIVHLSAGGAVLRVQLSNVFGTRYLVFDSVRVARAVSASSAAIEPGSDRAVTVGGKNFAVVPPGGTYVSDPIALTMPALSNLAVSFHLAEAPQGETLHQGSHAVSYFLHGNHAGDVDLPGAMKIEHWISLGEVDVEREAVSGGTLVCFGDSITDGHASTTNGNDRWPDVLAVHVAGSRTMRGRGVVNEGIGGNHLLTDGLGENAIGRLDRDLLAVSGVREAVVLEGINDVGMLARGKNATAAEHAQLVQHMETALLQMIVQGHAHGIRMIGATMTPFVGSDYYRPTAENEADRVAVNEWLRTRKPFDVLIDLDAVTRDPRDPSRLLPAYDSGDHLHPGPAGYRAMGDAVWAVVGKK